MCIRDSCHTPLLFSHNCIEFAVFHTNTAFNTFVHINKVMFFHITMDCADRTITSTFGATNTFFRQHFKYGKFFTSTCRTTMVMYMSYIFITEILQGRQNGVGRCLTQRAQRVVFDIMAQGFQLDVYKRQNTTSAIQSVTKP